MSATKDDGMARAILATLLSTRLSGRDGEAANLVDVVADLADRGRQIANAITPLNAAAGHDAAGGTVDSLTEAVMGVTGGLVKIADAIGDLAEAIRDCKR